VTVRETVNASKERIGAADLDRVFAGASRIVVAKGKKVEVFEPGKKDFDAAAMRDAVLGPTGNLRAPAVRMGKTWLVGFHEEEYGARLG
jgi:hypothetical protein